MSTLPSVVLLDALGTLVALEPPVPRLRSELAERFGIIVSEAEASAAITAEFAYYRTHLDEGRDRVALEDLRGRCAEVMRAALPPTSGARDVDHDAITETLLASLHFTPFADAEPALRSFREVGVPTVVVSNWDVSLHHVLARVSLAPLLDGIVTSAEVGARKPSPAIFEAALRLARAEPTQAVHVGDTVAEDVAGARAAGIEPILILRSGRVAVAGVRTISTLTELVQRPLT